MQTWWLLLDYTFLLFMALFFGLGFNLVVIPFEERDLRALFGTEGRTMADELLLGRIASNPAIVGGKPIIRGISISVELVQDAIRNCPRS